MHLCGEYVPAMVERGRGRGAERRLDRGLPAARRGRHLLGVEGVRPLVHRGAEQRPEGHRRDGHRAVPGPRAGPSSRTSTRASTSSSPDFVWMSAEECARTAVKGLERGKRVVVPGVGNRIGTLAGQHAPRSVLLAAARRFYPLGKLAPRYRSAGADLGCHDPRRRQRGRQRHAAPRRRADARAQRRLGRGLRRRAPRRPDHRPRPGAGRAWPTAPIRRARPATTPRSRSSPVTSRWTSRTPPT